MPEVNEDHSLLHLVRNLFRTEMSLFRKEVQGMFETQTTQI